MHLFLNRLTSFTSAPDYSREDIKELKESLSPFEKQLCSELHLLYIRGKRGRKVPLIIPPNCLTLMSMLVENRKQAGICKRNKYFFARFSAFTQIRACDSIRMLTEEANLEDPQTLRMTKLRKYTSTVSQVFSMKSNQNEWLADHLGHSLQVHKEHYQMPSGIIEKAKIAKLLLAIDAGVAGNCMGKTLDEIDINGKFA